MQFTLLGISSHSSELTYFYFTDRNISFLMHLQKPVIQTRLLLSAVPIHDFAAKKDVEDPARYQQLWSCLQFVLNRSCSSVTWQTDPRGSGGDAGSAPTSAAGLWGDLELVQSLQHRVYKAKPIYLTSLKMSFELYPWKALWKSMGVLHYYCTDTLAQFHRDQFTTWTGREK